MTIVRAVEKLECSRMSFKPVLNPFVIFRIIEVFLGGGVGGGGVGSEIASVPLPPGPPGQTLWTNSDPSQALVSTFITCITLIWFSLRLMYFFIRISSPSGFTVVTVVGVGVVVVVGGGGSVIATVGGCAVVIVIQPI